ncbi:hypothetical protein QJS66_15070 [Kocuria rhizophila]|nr:hypothetical protein QJS66_15070 [Kocuria rhizophila]
MLTVRGRAAHGHGGQRRPVLRRFTGGPGIPHGEDQRYATNGERVADREGTHCRAGGGARREDGVRVAGGADEAGVPAGKGGRDRRGRGTCRLTGAGTHRGRAGPFREDGGPPVPPPRAVDPARPLPRRLRRSWGRTPRPTAVAGGAPGTGRREKSGSVPGLLATCPQSYSGPDEPVCNAVDVMDLVSFDSRRPKRDHAAQQRARSSWQWPSSRTSPSGTTTPFSRGDRPGDGQAGTAGHAPARATAAPGVSAVEVWLAVRSWRPVTPAAHVRVRAGLAGR